MSKTKFGIYPAYLFRDHDPVLDVVDTVISDSEQSLQEIHEHSRVSLSTLRNWQNRKTKRPQWATVAAVFRSVGADIVINYRNKDLPVVGLKRLR